MKSRHKCLLVFLLILHFFLIACPINPLTAHGQEGILEREFIVSNAMDIENIKKNMIGAGLGQKAVERLISVLKLKGQYVKQTGAIIVIGDAKSIRQGNYLIAGLLESPGASDLTPLLGILEYKKGYLSRLDLSDFRTFHFQGGGLKDYRLVIHSPSGNRRYEAFFKNGTLQHSELHLHDFDLSFKYDRKGNLTRECFAALENGGRGYILNKIEGIGFYLHNRQKVIQEVYSLNGRRIFPDNMGPIIDERDVTWDQILFIPNATDQKGSSLKLTNIIKETVTAITDFEGDSIRIITRSGVLGDKIKQTAGKKSKNEKTGKISWIPIPTPILRLDIFGRQAFSNPVQYDCILTPIGLLFNKDYNEEEQWIADKNIWPWLVPIFKAKTIIVVNEKRVVIGKYGADNQNAYQLVWEVRVVRVSDRRVISAQTFYGGEPPQTKPVNNLPGYGDPPQEQAREWLEILIENPIGIPPTSG